jgi:hyperosmotically inducible periplasmic protein
MLSTGVQWPEKMILRICAVLTVLVLLAGVCLADDKVVSDDAIYDRVRISLASDAEVKGGDLKVDVKQGVVTLTGTLENSHLKDKAGKLAKKVKGVKQVVNNIEIKKRG